jgi:hypothetical protein
MPVRFQVDPDFYDHPKVTGMPDAAFSLWVRAGSYSAAKLTNGFISEDVLAHTLRSDMQVAGELVQRGLWRRRKGGFQFHQWELRNLTRERVEADREADRKRKRSARQKDFTQAVDNDPEGTDDARQTEKPQNNGEVVRPDSKRNPSSVHKESKPNPTVSVSVSSSLSSSSTSRGERPVGRRASEQRPPERCSRHTNDERPPNCGACADARRSAEAWNRDHRAAIRACPFCDADSWRYKFGHRIVATPYQRCDHTPPERP